MVSQSYLIHSKLDINKQVTGTLNVYCSTVNHTVFLRVRNTVALQQGYNVVLFRLSEIVLRILCGPCIISLQDILSLWWVGLPTAVMRPPSVAKTTFRLFYKQIIRLVIQSQSTQCYVNAKSSRALNIYQMLTFIILHTVLLYVQYTVYLYTVYQTITAIITALTTCCVHFLKF